MRFWRLARGGAKLGVVMLEGGTVLMDGSGAPTDGTTGTGAGFAGRGSLYFRTDNGLLYRNGGTSASPAWLDFGSAGFASASASVSPSSSASRSASP